MADRIVLPPGVKRYFWGDDGHALDWEKHRTYIIGTLLEKGDEKAIHWLLSKTGPETLKSLLPQLRLSDRSARFWSLYFS